MDFHILVNGIEEYSVAGSTSTHVLPESFFDFQTTVQIGDMVDFVLGNNNGTPNGDESELRATISVLDGVGPGMGATIPEPGALVLLGDGLIGLLALLWWKRKLPT